MSKNGKKEGNKIIHTTSPEKHKLAYNSLMTKASKVADYLILKSPKSPTEGFQITNKRLQKLLYYIQAWSLALNNKPIFEDKIEAWIHGPAIREIYETYKDSVANPINRISNPKVAEELGKDTVAFIDRIVSAYSKYDTATLEFMTHSELPWQEARRGLEANQSSSNEITWDSMKSYYSSRLSEVK